MDKLAKIRRHHWKGRLKISKINKFERDLLKTNEDIAPQIKTRIFTDVCMVGAQTCHHPPPSTIHTFVDFRSLKINTYHSQI